MADYLRIARAALAGMSATPKPLERTMAGPTFAESPKIEPDPDSAEGFTAANAEPAGPEPLESMLKNRAIELWSDAAGRLFLVADEEDAVHAVARFTARRGEVYTAAEMRCIVAVRDPAIAAEIHEWKRQFDGVLRG